MSEEKPATPEVQALVDSVRGQAEKKMNRTFHEFHAISYTTQVELQS